MIHWWMNTFFKERISEINFFWKTRTVRKKDYPLSGQNTPNCDWNAMTDEFLEKVNGMVIPESLRKCESRRIKKLKK